MGRPRAITDEEILSRARAAFLERGISATTEEIAARCGVGEATLFRRFPTKHALFDAAMRDSEPSWKRTLEARIDDADVEQLLVDLGLEIVAWEREALPLFMMRACNPQEEQLHRPAPAAAFAELGELFRAQHRAGRVLLDPHLATLIYLGTIQQLVLGGADEPLEEILSGVAEVLCHRPRRTS